MKKNVGIVDSHIRLVAGFSMLGIGVLRASKTMIGLGAMKIATGISGFCPILYALNMSTTDIETDIEKVMKKVPEYAEQITENLNLEME
ncbi:MAG TPA: DUF2892 domain-containing protein [Clostridia bacterium]|nr:DUF2892 domain-containing protein [Clostridia bacterium]